MKFLVDAQLPKALADFMNAQGLEAVHTLELPDKNKTQDGYISRLATTEKLIVVSKDAVFWNRMCCERSRRSCCSSKQETSGTVS